MQIIRGPNFSGRSGQLADMMLVERRRGAVGYIGASAASSLTGLTTTVEAEVALLLGWAGQSLPNRLSRYFEGRGCQLLSSLSGGEQVLLALAGLARPGLGAAGIDTALEQLDAQWRSWALAELDQLGATRVALIDNRLTPNELAGHQVNEAADGPAWTLPVEPVLPSVGEWTPTDITVRQLSFCYARKAPVFDSVSFTLHSGSIYHLAGANGSGKTTLLRILCGVLRTPIGQLVINGNTYQPHCEGNRLIALSMQNPDQQWTDITVADDLYRRIQSLRPECGHLSAFEAVVEHWKATFGDAELFERHVLDIPRAMRRRLSWLWPLSGILPWSVFDEPTLGQDDSVVAWFAQALVQLAQRGHGVIIVSHDDRLLRALPHLRLQLNDAQRVTIA